MMAPLGQNTHLGDGSVQIRAYGVVKDILKYLDRNFFCRKSTFLPQLKVINLPKSVPSLWP